MANNNGNNGKWLHGRNKNEISRLSNPNACEWVSTSLFVLRHCGRWRIRDDFANGLCSSVYRNHIEG